MKKIETIIVPKSKCPLDVLAQMGQRTAGSWIFLHKNCIDKMVKSIDALGEHDDEVEFCWDATDEYPATTVVFEKSGYLWREVYKIAAEDIAFSSRPNDPQTVLFIKTEE